MAVQVTTQEMHQHGVGMNPTTAQYLFDWFGDRSVGFPSKKGDVFTGTVDQMLGSFDILAMTQNLVFWRLKPEAIQLIWDPLGALIDMAMVMKPDEVSVFSTHFRAEKPEDEPEEADVIEQITSVPESWYHQHKTDENLHQALRQLMDQRAADRR